jgi:hypothetical protein
VGEGKRRELEDWAKKESPVEVSEKSLPIKYT